MANNLCDRMEETGRWLTHRWKVDQTLREEVNKAIKTARLINWQKFHEAMDLLAMSDNLKVDTLLKEAIKG